MACKVFLCQKCSFTKWYRICFSNYSCHYNSSISLYFIIKYFQFLIVSHIVFHISRLFLPNNYTFLLIVSFIRLFSSKIFFMHPKKEKIEVNPSSLKIFILYYNLYHSKILPESFLASQPDKSALYDLPHLYYSSHVSQSHTHLSPVQYTVKIKKHYTTSLSTLLFLHTLQNLLPHVDIQHLLARNQHTPTRHFYLRLFSYPKERTSPLCFR